MVSILNWRANTTKVIFYSTFLLIATLGLGCGKKPNNDGGVATPRIRGASMAPTLLGEHFRVECADCFFEFPIDADEVPFNQMAVCPNCGYGNNSIAKLKRQPPTAVSLAIGNQNINRWDVVAFRYDTKADTNGLKRVVGLPGETVRIVNGDILVDGVFVMRSESMKNEMRLLCYDSRFVAGKEANSASARLFPSSKSSRWTETETGFNIRSGSEKIDANWLHYQSVNCYASDQRRQPSDGVEDNYGYNQSISRSAMNRVDQLFVEVRVELDVPSRFGIMIRVDGRLVWFGFDSTTLLVTIQDGLGNVATSDWEPTEGEMTISVSTIDQRFQAFVNGKMVGEISTERLVNNKITKMDHGQPFLPEFDSISTQVPISIFGSSATDSGQVMVNRVKIFRDIHYLSIEDREFVLGPDEFFVLGDNCPVSVDSRHWSNPGLHRTQIIGVVGPSKKD